MGYFLIRRTFWAIFLFVVASMVTYLIFYVIPADPAQLSAGHQVSATVLAHIKHEMGLDKPIYQQYWDFLWNIVRHGSLGASFINQIPVDTTLKQDIPVTASIVLGGVFWGLVLAIPVGIISALWPRSIIDRTGMVFVLLGISAPAVWIGLIFSYIFGFKLGWTPIANYCDLVPNHQVGVCSGPTAWAYHMVLPWATFMLLFSALYVRLIRANMMETMSEDYVRTARAKGGSSARVLFHHVLRNSMLPVVTILGMDIGLSLAGALFIEEVFSMQGLGAELVTAVDQDNLPVVVGIVMFATLAVIVFNFLVDCAYAWLDPRIRVGG